MKLLFAITEFYRGGAETALLNLFSKIDMKNFEIDFLIMKQVNSEESLIELVPKWIRTLDAGIINRKYTYNLWDDEYKCGGIVAKRFVSGKKYDLAISFGEWCYHDFVAKEVVADKKAVWIHTDITSLPDWNDREFFQYYFDFDYYIFAAEGIRKKAVEKFSFIKTKSKVIHNVMDQMKIIKQSQDKVNDFKFTHKYKIITVANIRKEKGYHRIIEVCKQLNCENIDFEWLCIGKEADLDLVRELKNEINAFGLQDRLILLGQRSNPHAYTRMADVFVLLSDYEATPLSIVEAHILGKFVIATDTVGARELIDDKVNGYICEFETNKISQLMKKFFLNKSNFNNISEKSYNSKGLDEWYEFIEQI